MSFDVDPDSIQLSNGVTSQSTTWSVPAGSPTGHPYPEVLACLGHPDLGDHEPVVGLDTSGARGAGCTLTAAGSTLQLTPYEPGPEIHAAVIKSWVYEEETRAAVCRDAVVKMLRENADPELHRRADKIAKCSLELVFGVRQTGPNLKGRSIFTVSVVHANRCSHTSLCPICIAARQRSLASQVRYSIEPFLEKYPGHGAWWFTLTRPRVPVEQTWAALADLKDAAVRRLFRRKDWPTGGHILMYEPHIGQQYIDFSRPITAHVHLHAVGLIRPEKLAAANQWDYERLSDAWSAAYSSDVFAHLYHIAPHPAAKLAGAIAGAVSYGCKGIYRQGKDTAGIMLEPGIGLIGEPSWDLPLYYSNGLIDERVLAAYLAKPEGARLYSPSGVFKRELKRYKAEKRRRRQRDAMATEKCVMNWDACTKAFVNPASRPPCN